MTYDHEAAVKDVAARIRAQGLCGAVYADGCGERVICIRQGCDVVHGPDPGPSRALADAVADEPVADMELLKAAVEGLAWAAPKARIMDPDKLIPRSREALARIASSPRGWQPIETAPKDGTEVVLVGRLVRGAEQVDETRVRSCISRWAKDATEPPYVRGWSFSAPGYVGNFEPTHWMPLPVFTQEKKSMTS